MQLGSAHKCLSVTCLTTASLMVALAVCNPALAQKGASDSFGGFGFPTVAPAGPKLAVDASFQLRSDGKAGKLQVSAKIAEGFHAYSTTQADGGPLPTKIDVSSEAIQLTGPFVPDHKPTVSKDDIYPGILIEEFHGAVTWTAPFSVVKELDPEKSKIDLTVDALVCGSGSCEPVSETAAAAFSGTYAAAKTVQSLRVEKTHAEWSANLSHATVAPGEATTLNLRVTPDEGYHVYRHVPQDAETLFRTVIVGSTKSGLRFGEPTTSAKLKQLEGAGLESIEFYEGTVDWTIPVSVPADALPGEYPIELLVGFYTCNDRSCDPPAGLTITGNVTVGQVSTSKTQLLGLAASSFDQAGDAPNLTSWIDQANDQPPLLAGETTTEDQVAAAPTLSLTLTHLLAALAGGFILNFMPCVLPVIGLKVLSFADQAGNSQRRVIALNLAYVAGIITVMLVLAAATVIAKLAWGTAFGWGQQFTVLEFKVVLAALVFAMALSFLGVWEIPIPGFAMSSKSGQLMEKEGLFGAFTKGILTTVLATPCSGPFLGSLFGLSLSLSSASVVFLYFVVGLGMSLPYLILCIYPGFIKVLPKPGPWMETFKQVLAFPLLFTVVFFVAAIDNEHRVATLILLMVVWFACWLIGKVPAYADAPKRVAAWTTGLTTIGLGAWVSFTYFGPVDHQLPWVDYNENQLAKLRSEGKTVMIDFTANWCWNCQVNMRVAIDKANVAKVVDQNNVVPMVADLTGHSEEIYEKLRELGSNSIPLLAIFPPDPSAKPILLRDLVTESQVVEALKEAGPSLPKSQFTSSVH